MTTPQASLAQNGIRAAVETVFYPATGEEAEIGIVKMTAGVGTLIQLPDPTVVGPRKPIVIMDESGTAGATAVQIITVTPIAGTINGAASLTLVRPFQAMTVYSDGKQWLCPNPPDNLVQSSTTTTVPGPAIPSGAFTPVVTSGPIKVAAGQKVLLFGVTTMQPVAGVPMQFSYLFTEGGALIGGVQQNSNTIPNLDTIALTGVAEVTGLAAGTHTFEFSVDPSAGGAAAATTPNGSAIVVVVVNV